MVVVCTLVGAQTKTQYFLWLLYLIIIRAMYQIQLFICTKDASLDVFRDWEIPNSGIFTKDSEY